MRHIDRYSALDQIANSIHAANRIHGLRNKMTRSENGSDIMPNNLSLINEALKIICEYSPHPRKKVLEQAIDKSNLYSNTYRNLRQHITANRSQQIEIDSIAQLLYIIKPVLNGSTMVTADKLLKIYEILKT